MPIPEDFESMMDDADSAFFMGGHASQEDYDDAMGAFDGPDLDDYYYDEDDDYYYDDDEEDDDDY